MKEAEEFVRRGRLAQSDIDDIVASQEKTRKRLHGIEDAAVEETRVTLKVPVEFTVPMELWTANRLDAMQPIHRGRHRKRQARVVAQAWLLTFRGKTPALPLDVTFTRFGRRTDDHDNLGFAFKHVTDEVTRLLGLRNDDTEEVSWRFQQEPRGSEAMKIRIMVSPR